MKRNATIRPAQSHNRFVAVAVAALVVIVLVAAMIGYSMMRPGAPKDFSGTGDGTTQLVEIKEGETVSGLGPELVKRGVVASDSAFQTAAANNPKAASITPGFYRLQGKMSAKAAVAALVDSANKVEFLTVPGGATLEDVTVVGGDTRLGIYSMIARVSCGENDSECVTVAKLENAAATTDPETLGVPEWARAQVLARGDDPKRLEGLIAPGEYMLNPNHNAQEILKDLITKSAQKWNETGIVEKAQNVGIEPYELLTAASLVERESPAGEFNKVARVILNRLAAPMRLEFDSTVNYGLPSQEVATTDADRAQVTPWNTYAKDGLPDTPIASPSVDAVSAMENPAEGNWLFFVTVDKDGTTVFNETFEDHMRDTQRAIDSGILDSNRDSEAAPGEAAPAPEQPAAEQ